MKKLLLAAFAVVTLGGIGSAQAWITANDCLNDTSCTSGISVDSGSSGKQCAGSESFCSCQAKAESMACPSWGTYSGGCPSGMSRIGTTVTGLRCCVSLPDCSRTEPETEQKTEVANNTEEADLEEVFAPDATASYFGVVNLISRSPNYGRSNATNARLDACLGYSNVDSFSDYLSCETACGDTSKNGYCQNSGGAVCIDRCKCKYPGNGTCNGY